MSVPKACFISLSDCFKLGIQVPYYSTITFLGICPIYALLKFPREIKTMFTQNRYRNIDCNFTYSKKLEIDYEQFKREMNKQMIPIHIIEY